MTATERNVKRKHSRESAEGEAGSEGGQTKLTLTGDRREVEAMALELRRLAKEHGLEFRNMRIQPADEKS